MSEFYDRTTEIETLNQIVRQPGAQFVMVFGRRRVGKTTLLTTWAGQTGLPTLYWVAKRDSREALMADLAQAIYAWQHDLDYSGLDFRPSNWEGVLRTLAQAAGSRRVVVILDELPYALEQDRALGSYLQAAWDHLFKETQICLFLSGSHIGMLTGLTHYQAPLYGRLTAQFPVSPLTFANIRQFLPHYSASKRLAVYAILGGIPAYLERWNDRETISTNVERLFLQRTGWFRNEPLVLISDLTQRETTNFEAILKALADGRHGRDEIAHHSGIPSTSLSHYLPRLIELGLVERRLPATVPLPQLKTSKQSRYFLSDPFLRFYYRFVDPNLGLIERGLARRLWQMMDDHFRAFVALTFEELCREWVVRQARRGQFPFLPENVGSHWSAEVQIDVVAINWRERQLWLGECKWGDQLVGQGVIAELIEEKTPKLLRALADEGIGWTIHYAFFARKGFTPAARSAAAGHKATLVDLEQMTLDLE
ncbi:MAG: ATP-binding protein [Chloroflexota bacterium]